MRILAGINNISKTFYTKDASLILSMAKKKRVKRTRKKPRKQDRRVFLYVALAVVCCILLFLLLQTGAKCPFSTDSDAANHVPLEKQIVIENKYANAEEFTLYFTVKNPYDMPTDCYVQTPYERFTQDIGVIGANSQKEVRFDLVGDIDIDVKCEWKDIVGCEGSLFEVCGIVKDNPKLASCLGNEVHYQPFCVALLLKDTKYCDWITLKHKRVHCHAYLENKPGLCSELDYDRDWCYTDIAQNTGNIVLCDEVLDEIHAARCKAVVEKDVSACPVTDGVTDKYCVDMITSYSEV